MNGYLPREYGKIGFVILAVMHEIDHNGLSALLAPLRKDLSLKLPEMAAMDIVMLRTALSTDSDR